MCASYLYKETTMDDFQPNSVDLNKFIGVHEDKNEYSEDEGDDADLYQSEDEFMTRLQECLDDVHYQGTFSACQKLSVYPNPGLQVKEVGTIGLPLSARDAQAVASVCKQSPFGKGDETVIDETVRKTWELDTTEFVCRNPAWMTYLNTLTQQAIQDLGVQVPASAQPYKLLLYEEGAFFKPHRDTEKVPGMFGTLVVCLLSEHTGGEVLLVHGRKQRTIETATESAFGLSALAWYSDVQHEIKPVTSGYRLVITYNLVQDQALPRQTAAALDASYAKLEKLLHYTEASLSLGNLKAQDAAKARYLEHLCVKNGVYWFLAQMTRNAQEDYFEEDTTEEIQLGETFTPTGKHISSKLTDIDPVHILADVDDLYGGRSADSEDEGEYTGNENMPSAYRYHNTVVVLVRKEHAIGRFSDGHQHSAVSLTALFELIKDDPHCSVHQRHNAVTTVLRRSLEKITLKNRSDHLRYHWTTYSVDGTNPHEERAEWAKLFETVSDYCDTLELHSVIGEILQGALVDRDWAKSKELVALIARQVAKETTAGKQNAWSHWLSAPLPPVPSFSHVNERHKTFEAVGKTLPPTCVVAFNKWKSAQLKELLQTVKSYSREDAEPLLELMPNIVPETYFGMQDPQQGGISRFLYLLGTTTVHDVITCENIVKPTYQHLLQASLPSLKLSLEELSKDPNEHYGSRPLHVGTSTVEFLEIIDRCMKLGLEAKAHNLLREGLPKLPAPEFSFWSKWQRVYVFNREMVDLLQSHNNAQLNSAASPFITNILRTSSSFLASSLPKEPGDWARPHVRRDSCGCDPCRAVQAFLMNPTQSIGRFSYAEKIRSHLKYSFDDGHDFIFDTEKGKSPYTLVIRKTNRQYIRLLQQWKSDVNSMRIQLNAMRTQFMRNLLGGDVLQVAGLDDALVAGGAPEGVGANSSQPLQPSSASTQNRAPLTPAVGTKRKASYIVDLTED
ncbi:hypothetical protein N0V83_009265 [Neocucurbitaria cava]|uniref:Prolyl 4-hydroxylase alpha subunit Fe(2+) 2OG dioxygenase domain-containing protein n=1 Tax=Neocucurbitaria cava TaxID=798079 RepID=A0A9W8Y0J6_9PLEO|nr:hypothetical protein N0V83_009265 [Neocucurbitaria cava]